MLNEMSILLEVCLLCTGVCGEDMMVDVMYQGVSLFSVSMPTVCLSQYFWLVKLCVQSELDSLESCSMLKFEMESRRLNIRR